MGRRWTVEETERLLSRRKLGLTCAQCAVSIGRTVNQVKAKLRKLGATRANSIRGKRQFEIRWNERELKILRRNYGRLTRAELSRRLERTPDAIAMRAKMLGLQKAKPKWQYRDLLSLLTQNAPSAKVQLSQARTTESVQLMRVRLLKHFRSGTLDKYIRTRPGAPSNACVQFGSTLPPAFRFDGSRASPRAKARRDRDYLTRGAERERQKAASKKWQVKM